MFLRSLPILVENRLVPIPKPLALAYARSQTHRFFHRPHSPSFQISCTTAAVLPSPHEVVFSSSSGQPEPLPPQLLPERMPKHVAVIMDGHAKWARLRGLPVSAGHEAGVRSLMTVIDLCCRWGIKVLSIFLFSCDNWARSEEEVGYLMSLFETTISSQIETFERQGVQFSVIGDKARLPMSLQRTIRIAEERTKQNSKLQFMVAISYSGKYDILQACKAIAMKVRDGVIQLEDISESVMEQELATSRTEFPSPDLMIRTSGELRVSNFMLWQLAFTEFVFDSQLFPDFGKDQFVEALASFQKRERRFGGRPSSS